CGYIGEKVGWHYGFGLAGIFMLFGALQFYFGRRIFGIIGLSPKASQEMANARSDADKASDAVAEKEVPKNVERDRLVVIGILMVFSIFFWLSFEQAGGSMSIFALDYTQ